jgi:hypothetical protein
MLSSDHDAYHDEVYSRYTQSRKIAKPNNSKLGEQVNQRS